MSRRKQSNPKPIKRAAEEELSHLADLLDLPTEVLYLNAAPQEDSEPSVFCQLALVKGTYFGPFPGKVVSSIQNLDDSPLEILDEYGRRVLIELADDTGGWLKLLKAAPSLQDANVTISTQGDEVWCVVKKDIAAFSELTGLYKPSCKISDGVKDNCLPSRLLNNSAADMNENELSTKSQESCNNPLIYQTIKVEDESVKMVIKLEPVSPPQSPEGSEENLNYTNDIGNFHNNIDSVHIKIEANEDRTPSCPERLNNYDNEDASSRVPDSSPTPISSLCFVCDSCNIRFSSYRTMEAHKTFYCSQRKNGLLPNSEAEKMQHNGH